MQKISQLLSVLLLFFLTVSCGDDEDSGPSTPQVSSTSAAANIELVDVGNSGSTSDLAVSYTAPSSTRGISELRIFLVNGATNQITEEEALGFDSELYLSVAPGTEVVGVGVSLGPLKKDIAGNEITFPGSYSVGILSVPSDENFRPSMAFSSSATTIKISNEVVAYTSDITTGHENTVYAGAGAGGLVIDKEGNIYMADMGYAPIPGNGGTNVLKISPSRSISIFSTNFNQPFGNYITDDGTIYQSSYADGSVWRIPADGSQRFRVEISVNLTNPDGIAADDEGNLYIADCGSSRIVKVSTSGQATVIPARGNCPKGIVFANGFLYISYNNETGMIRRMDKEGNFEEIGSIPVFKPDDYPLEYLMWLGYLTYHNDELYIAGTSTHKIYKMTLDGQVTVLAGTGQQGVSGGDALKARLNRPMDVIVSNDGNSLFINCSTDMEPSHTQAFLPSRIWEIKLLETD